MEEIFQFAVFIVLLLGWILKAIADKKRGSQQRHPAPPPEPEGEEPRLEMPDQSPTGRPPALPPRPRPVPTHVPMEPLARDRPIATVRPHLGALHSSVEEKHLESRLAGRHLRIPPAAATDAESASQARIRRRREATVRRLTAGLASRPGRNVTRAGVLWSEVLAKPRALAGPHRSPTAKRYDPR